MSRIQTPNRMFHMLFEQLQRNAEYFPHDVAIVFGDASLTHLALLQRVERCAQGLLELGISPGDRVALMLENSPDFITAFFAIAACRGVNVPLNLELKEDEIRFFLSDARIRAAFVDSPRLERVNNALSDTDIDPSIMLVGDAQPGTMSITTLGLHSSR